MKLKRLSILFVNYHHHENRILQDDPLIVDTVGDNLDLSTCNICQILLNFFTKQDTLIPKMGIR